eukprot:TRINITY_DN2909_c0_g1_i1.p1 TRINITY_DN2909_c0_g1~~TRINITY_DN2909_c0_g1_i1.p1  ORF type:complete len:592 (+),score=114.07 TRINITY_DN2909_c0_g1_i1:267-1778(+)
MRDIWDLDSDLTNGLIAAAIGAFLISGLAVLAGIGGGGMLVPLYINALGASPRLAVPISQATIFGSSLVNVSVNVRRKHPKGERPAIDYAAAGVLMPMTLAGTTLGKVLGNIVPGWLRLFVLCLLLGYTLKKTIARALLQHAKEKELATCEASAQQRQEDAPVAIELDERPAQQDGKAEDGLVAAGKGPGGPEEDEGPLLRTAEPKPEHEVEVPKAAIEEPHPPLERSASWAPSTPDNPGGDFSLGFDAKCPPSMELPRQVSDVVTDLHLRVLQKKAAMQFPPYWLVLLGSSWTLLGLFSYGQHATPCGQVLFWGFVAAIVLCNLGLAGLASRKVRSEFATRVALNFPFCEDDIRWEDDKYSIQYPLVAVTAGMAASLLGIGGGMILGPMLYEMGMTPQAQSATSGLATFFVASGTVTQFAIGGDINASFPAVFCFIGFVAAAVGHFGIGHYIRKYQRTSLIIWSMVFIIAGSMVALGITGAMKVYKNVTGGGNIGFRPLCGA